MLKDITNRICVSIGASDYAACCKVAQGSAMFELRLDLMPLDLEQVRQLLRYPALTVAACREGKFDAPERLQLLQFA
ncbi:MAG: hypothetical protein LBB79_05145, partial [Prevotellaceae bacterium]|nr:hypothetical protein [Prevotellaceae bacterium]